MTKFYKIAAALLIGCFAVSEAWAQEDDERTRGRFSASFETNSTAYFRDNKTGAVYPDDHFGSNNYLKLDYIQGRFAVGAQLESYLPVLQGYPVGLDTTKVMFKYVTWTDKNFSVTAGDFYDQFGNGLIFRSWEDRALGFNNSLEGARVTYNWDNKIALKALWGRPRMWMSHAHTQIRGLDGIISVSNLAGWNDHILSLEGSYLNKYSRLSSTAYGDLAESPSVDWYSGRLNYDYAGFSLRTEYAAHGKDMFFTYNDRGLQPINKKGNAQLVEVGYSGNGLGVLATFRRLEYMDNKIIRDQPEVGNNINYLPSLSQQFTYLLTNLHPATALPDNEIGGQVDVFYNFKRGTALGGKRGMKIHVNYSRSQALDKVYDDDTQKVPNALYYQGASVDIEKWWNRNFKTTILYSFQEYNPSYGGNEITEKRHIFVGDVTYKFTPKTSMRAELQYLYSKDAEKDWIAGLLEFNFAPRWSIYASDMYNLGYEKVDENDENEKLNYYNVGFSYTHSKTRVAISYGRNREGYICSGGVCRLMPAYTGININLAIAF